MQRMYKFRLHPTNEQEQKLQWVLDKCRYIYNILLSRLNEQKVTDKGQLQGDITDLRKIEPKLQDIYPKTLQYKNYGLFSNLKISSQLKKKGKKVGGVRFKGKGWFKNFTNNQSGFKIINHNIRFDSLHLSKIEYVLMILHRKIDGKIKQITIKHQPSGRDMLL